MNLKVFISFPFFVAKHKNAKKMCLHLITRLKRRIVNSFISKGSDRDYQLWVNSGKEEAPYPLIGKFL